MPGSVPTQVTGTVEEKVIQSSKPLELLTYRSAVDANFANPFTGLNSGLGNFFIVMEKELLESIIYQC